MQAINEGISFLDGLLIFSLKSSELEVQVR